MTNPSVGVVGGGTWGRALAKAARRAGSEVVLHTRREHERADEGVTVTVDYAMVARAPLVVLAVPSPVVRPVLVALGDHLTGQHLVVHGVRGLETETLETVSDMVRDETASAIDAATGHWPLHVLIAQRPYRLKERDAIVAVLRPARSAASAMDRAGDVPLHRAIRNKIPWHSGVDVLVEAAPHTLGYRDRTTRLLPFQLAATQDGRQAVETSFQLLRRQPDLL